MAKDQIDAVGELHANAATPFTEAFAMPKSVTLTSPSQASITFLGLMSR